MISRELEIALHRCFVAAREARHARITLDHLMLALLSQQAAMDHLSSLGVDAEKLRTDLHARVGRTEAVPAGKDDFDTLPDQFFQLALQTAIIRVHSRGEKEVATLDVLKAILEQDSSYAPGMPPEAFKSDSRGKPAVEGGSAAALRFILGGAGLGLAIPLVFRLASAALDFFPDAPVALLTAFDYLQLTLWPTPLLLVPIEEPGAPDLSSWGSFAIAALANVTVYATLAGLVWMGLAKSRWILALPALLVAGIWYAIWRT